MARWLVPLGLAMFALIGGGIYYLAIQGRPVEAGRVERGMLREFIEERAKTRLPKTHRITMPFPGRILPIELEENDSVAKGQVVARMDVEDLRMQIEEARARVAQLEAKIAENQDISLERSGIEGVEQYLVAMDRLVEASEAGLESTGARREFAQDEYDRLRKLLGQGQTSRSEFDAAELERIQSQVAYQEDLQNLRAVEALRAATRILPRAIREYIEKKKLTEAVLERQKAEAEIALARLERDLERGTLSSPVDGVVLKRFVSNERFLPGGEELLEIGQLALLEVEVEVLSQDVVDVEIGNPVDILGPTIGNLPLRGEVVRIYPAGFTKLSSLGVEQQRVLVIVALDPEGLETLLGAGREIGVGYRVRVRIYTAQVDDALIVPRSAIFRGVLGDWRTFAIRDGMARMVPIEVGLSNDETVEVIAGLKEGDLVVLAPEADLPDGAFVEPVLVPTDELTPAP